MAKTSEPTQKPAQQPSEDIVKQVVSGFLSSWNYREASWHPLWDDWTKLYNSERVYVGYNGISDTFVPMAYSTVEAMVAATSGDKPMVEFVPTRPDQNAETDVLNGLFSFYWDLDNWTLKTVQHSRCLFKRGTSVMYGYWDMDHPVIEIIPLKDFFIDPTATFFNYQNAGYMGYRFFANKEDLAKEQVVDPDSGQLAPKYKNLDKLSDNFEAGEQTAKQEQDTHVGSTLDKEAQKNQIEVLCYFTLDNVYYVGNRQEVIYEDDNYFKQRQQFLGIKNPRGMYPFMIDVYNADEAQLYGQSPIQPIVKPQELLNDLTNQNVDAVSWSLDPEMELDPQYASYLDKMKSATGNVYPFKPGSYKAVQKPLLPTNAFNERINIKNEIREATAIDEIIKGIQARSDTTATQIKAQVASAGRRFDLLVSLLENGGYYTMAKLVFQLVKHYVTEPTMFRIIGKDGVDWKTFDPKQFQGDYEPRIKLKATLDNEKAMKLRDVKEMYGALVGNPFVDEAALTRFVIRKGFDLEPDEVDELVRKPEDMANATSKPDAKEDPKLISLTAIAKNYGKADPDIKDQLEHIAGLDPSELNPHAMETAQLQHGADQAQAFATADQSLTPQMPTDGMQPMNPMNPPDQMGAMNG